jgi:transcriptional regulator with XRE-family HTH domain
VSDLESLIRSRRLRFSVVASAAGISRAALWKLMRRQVGDVKLGVARKLAAVLGVTLDEFEQAFRETRRIESAERERRATVRALLGPGPSRRRRGRHPR